VLGSILSDVRYSIRSLSKRPVFATTAILTIAIGIGANTSMFTIVNGFLLRPLPYADPDELVAIWSEQPTLGWRNTDINPADAWDWRERATTLDDLAVFEDDGFILTGGDVPELLVGLQATPNLLALLGLAPALGRDFAPDEVGAAGDDVVILTHGFWTRRFARDPAVLGSQLTLDGEPVTVVGIMAEDFLFHDFGMPDLLRPFGFDPDTVARGGRYANAVARLANGVGVDAAREELVAIARELEAEHAENDGWTVSVTSLHADVVGDLARSASIVLMTAVGFILLMACVNVANLLLARAGARARDISVRLALGAARGRVLRQLLTESALLASVGGVFGLIGANWGYRWIAARMPATLPAVFRFEMDRSVFLFTAAITIGAALVFGMLPAVRATAPRAGILRDGGRAGRSRSSGRFGGALVVLQTSMAVVLLVGGGLVMKSLSSMKTQDFGFEPANVLIGRVALPDARYPTKEEAATFWRSATEALRSAPGVEAVGTTQSAPLEGSNWGRSIQIAGADEGADRSRSARLTYASPGLFDAIGFRLVGGRAFTDADGPDAPNVAIVNEAFVERYLGPDIDPLGATILSGEEWSSQIVGVLHDAVERSVDSPPEPSLYLPIAQTDVRTRAIVMRTASEPTRFVDALQAAVWSVDADLPVYEISTMESLVEDRLGGFAIIGYLMAVFALLSLLLGAVGIYGVTAHAAGQRTGEIGVRIAMGAERGDVVRMVVVQGARRAVLGLAIGLGLALLMGRAISGVLVGVSPRDPAIFAGVIVTLAVVSVLGLYLPARRAARVDPVRALAAE
jgi:predicted permease